MQDGPEEAAAPANAGSFILRVWIEETAEEGGQASWRGHITHVPSGERRYVQNSGAILRFIGAYLRAAGVPFDDDTAAPPGRSQEL